MKTVTFFKRSLFLFLGISVMTLMACDKDEKTPIDDDNNIITDWMFEMEVDGEKWKGTSASYVSYLHEQEEGSDEVDVYALTMNVVNANQETFSLLFSIPASKIQSATGVYEISQTEIKPNTYYVSGTVSLQKGNKTYVPHFDTAAKAGKVTLTKAVFGQQGIIDEIPFGNGLKEIEGTFEFELFEKSTSGDNKIKLKKGKFKLKSGIMQ